MIHFQSRKKDFNYVLLEKYQKKIGAFPQQYIEFLKEYNCGVPEPNIIKINNDEDNQISIQYFLGISKNKKEDIFSQYKFWKKYLPNGFLPIAYTEGGGLVCLSLNRSNFGAVHFWDHDDESVVEIGTDIDAFLHHILEYDAEKDDGEDLVIEEEWVDPEFQKLIKKGRI